MGTKAAEALDVSFDELPNYLHAKHSVYMEIGSETYYLTDVNDRYWRAQDTAKLNEKGHYVDASELVPTVSEFLTLPFIDGKSVTDVFDQAVFYSFRQPRGRYGRSFGSMKPTANCASETSRGTGRE